MLWSKLVPLTSNYVERPTELLGGLRVLAVIRPRGQGADFATFELVRCLM